MDNSEDYSQFSSRVKRVRERLGYMVKTEFADAAGHTNRNTYASWEKKAEAPSGDLLYNLVTSLRDPLGRPLAEIERVFFWLAGGVPSSKPSWLDDEDADPYEPLDVPHDSPPRPGIAMPRAALDAVRALEAHQQARAALEGADHTVPVMKARVALEETREAAERAKEVLSAVAGTSRSARAA